MKLKKKKVLSGGKLAGGNPKNERVENDFYATNPKAVEMLLEAYPFKGYSILEPCVGAGHIIQGIKNFLCDDEAILDITALDIVDRGYPNTIIQDFLKWNTKQKFDIIITNPPFSLAKEFVEKGLELLDEEGQMAMFLKIQFLEGEKRRELFQKFPPKYIYVFEKRMATWSNGQEFSIDEKTGKKKKWATTMCHAWFIWEKGSTSEPVVRFLYEK